MGLMKCLKTADNTRVCPNWVYRKCVWEQCNLPHVLTGELPRGYTKWLEDTIRTGVEALRQGRGQKQGRDNNETNRSLGPAPYYGCRNNEVNYPRV